MDPAIPVDAALARIPPAGRQQLKPASFPTLAAAPVIRWITALLASADGHLWPLPSRTATSPQSMAPRHRSPRTNTLCDYDGFFFQSKKPLSVCFFVLSCETLWLLSFGSSNTCFVWFYLILFKLIFINRTEILT